MTRTDLREKPDVRALLKSIFSVPRKLSGGTRELGGGVWSAPEPSFLTVESQTIKRKD